MAFVIEQLSLLGLNSREVRVFTTLSTLGRMNMTVLAKRAGLPRTTVDAIVRRLVKQGLIVQAQVGKRYEYLVALRDVSRQLDVLEHKLRPDESNLQSDISEIKNDETIVIKKTAIVSLPQLFKEHAGERVRMLVGKGKDGDEGSVERLFDYVDNASLENSKLELMVCRHVAQLVHEAPRARPCMQRTDVHLNVVPAGFCSHHIDLVVFRTAVAVIDLLTGREDVVVNEQVIETMKHLLDIASEVGWSVDLNAWIGHTTA